MILVCKNSAAMHEGAPEFDFQGEAVCALEERRIQETESCGE
jgi:hypothetical protein